MKATIGFSFAFALITLAVWSLFVAVPQIHAWEKANNYPYGKLCELYRTCR